MARLVVPEAAPVIQAVAFRVEAQLAGALKAEKSLGAAKSEGPAEGLSAALA